MPSLNENTLWKTRSLLGISTRVPTRTAMTCGKKPQIALVEDDPAGRGRRRARDLVQPHDDILVRPTGDAGDAVHLVDGRCRFDGHDAGRRQRRESAGHGADGLQE